MTAPRPRQPHLNAFPMNAGHHDAARRHSRTQPERDTDLRYFRQLARTAERGLLIARPGAGRGHRVEADSRAVWKIMPPHPLGGLEDFVDPLVPILRRRGLFRTECTGRTLSENYGLGRPANRPAATAAGEEVAV
ncbi:hypothetical protein [Streptomyces sp. NPDC003697]